MANELETINLSEESLLLIHRIGKRLLGVANCLVTFNLQQQKVPEGERSVEATEVQFVNSLPLSRVPEFIDDTRNDRFLSNHKNIVGAPYIRFYASHPIRHRLKENEVVGNVRVLDYAPRTLTQEEKESMADIAALVEREIEMLSTEASRQDLLKKNWSLRRESMIDPISGTWNRVAIKRMLNHEMTQCKESEKPLSVIMADIDDFKSISEQYGSNVGDALLLKLASRLRSSIRPHDSLGRFEDGKFLILLPGASHEIAKIVAERLQKAIQSNVESVASKMIGMTISAGTVSTDRFAEANTEELLSLASTTLQKANILGPGTIIQATPQNN